MDNTDRLIWVDIETFGLNVETDFILEVGFRITDLELETIDDLQVSIWETPGYDKRLEELTTDSWVYKTHTESGLFRACQAEGLTMDEADDRIRTFLSGYGIGKTDNKDDKEPLCGSSVQFDRSFLAYWLPDVEALFHYRNIDNSTIKELCRRYNRRIYSLLDETVKPEKKHRVLPDLTDTINEFSYYRDNFLWEA